MYFLMLQCWGLNNGIIKLQTQKLNSLHKNAESKLKTMKQLGFLTLGGAY